MSLNIADQYYLKAKGAMAGFCSDWEEACESISYAISYEENHCPSLCLLGTIQAKYLGNYEAAFENFDKCIAADITYVNVYPEYIKFLIWADEFSRAKQLLEFAKKIKSVSLAELYWNESYIHEVEKNYKQSLKSLKKAKQHIYNDNYMYFMEDEERRVRKKMKALKKKSKKGKSKKIKSKQKFNTILD
jgi:tetratricopeptide (TPR) repeat protein